MASQVEISGTGDVVGPQDGELVNGNSALFSPDSSEDAPVKEVRVIRKAKRLLKGSPHKEDGIVNGVSQVTLSANKAAALVTKNSRKSRNGRGRGLPKKGGAGGKGVWGKPGSELFATGETDDTKDPNYDSDSQEPFVVQEVQPELTEEEITEAVQPLLQEYLENGDTLDAMENIGELNIQSRRHKVASLAVSLAMDRHNHQREMTSRLISDMYGRLLTQEEIGRCFDELLNGLSDLTLDTPEAPEILGQFIARAVADDCLPPKFVNSYKGQVECLEARKALDKADVLLSMTHGMVRLDNVWGMGGGNRPVKYLIKRMVLLLKEYLSSGDLAEATRCVTELDVPHFHHELVYQAFLLTAEDMSENAIDLMAKFFISLSKSVIITRDQMDKGVKRIFDDIPDISLDIPAAYQVLEKLASKVEKDGIISEALLKDLPSRGRKRFVSEGDGGRIKEQQTLPAPQ